jgi:hypothetical protein
MKARKVFVDTGRADARCRDVDVKAGKLASYLMKYLTKGVVDAWETKKKLFGGSRSAKAGNVKFRWMPTVNAAAYLYHYGRELFIELYGKLPTWRQTNAVVRLGIETCDWASVDPWWEFSLGG